MTPRAALRPDPRVTGGLLCAAGFALLAWDGLLAAALGAELLATAFWWWARASDDPARHLPRWEWLRRPAAALWLAMAVAAAAPAGAPGPWRALEAGAVVWAGLELLAALPLARPFSDLPGPLLALGPWLPAVLPAAGFVVLWRHQEHWLGVARVRDTAAALLLVTAALAALRAFARRRWTAGLRWLMVGDGALAGLLVAVRAVPPAASLLLWLSASGAHAFLLGAELSGAVPRRGPVLSAIWRATTWTASAALAWPMLLAVGARFGAHGPLWFLAAAAPVALVAWVNVARMVEAPERRAVGRPGTGVALSGVAPLFALAGVPVALAIASWSGPPIGWGAALLALAPAAAGGLGGLLTFRGIAPGAIAAPADEPARSDRLAVWGRATRQTARRVFRLVTALERALADRVVWLLRLPAAPLRDLHSGDAQEYLLLLVGVAVLAVVLPLLG